MTFDGDNTVPLCGEAVCRAAAFNAATPCIVQLRRRLTFCWVHTLGDRLVWGGTRRRLKRPNRT